MTTWRERRRQRKNQDQPVAVAPVSTSQPEADSYVRVPPSTYYNPNDMTNLLNPLNPFSPLNPASPVYVGDDAHQAPPADSGD